MTTLKQLLIEAKALIDTPEKWTQHTLRRGVDGGWVEYSEDAVCFCSVGAIDAVTYGRAKDLKSYHPMYEALYSAMRNMQEELDLGPETLIGVAMYNDHNLMTHEKLMKAWDRAIEMAEG